MGCGASGEENRAPASGSSPAQKGKDNPKSNEDTAADSLPAASPPNDAKKESNDPAEEAPSKGAGKKETAPEEAKADNVEKAESKPASKAKMELDSVDTKTGVTVKWNLAGSTVSTSDYVAICNDGSADADYITYEYASGTQEGKATICHTVAGKYLVRYYDSNGKVLVSTETFSIGGDAAGAQNEAAAGKSTLACTDFNKDGVTASWTLAKEATDSDYIAICDAKASNPQLYETYAYNSKAAKSGSATISHALQPGKEYVLRYFDQNSKVLVESPAFKMEGGGETGGDDPAAAAVAKALAEANAAAAAAQAIAAQAKAAAAAAAPQAPKPSPEQDKRIADAKKAQDDRLQKTFAKSKEICSNYKSRSSNEDLQAFMKEVFTKDWVKLSYPISVNGKTWAETIADDPANNAPKGMVESLWKVLDEILEPETNGDGKVRAAWKMDKPSKTTAFVISAMLTYTLAKDAKHDENMKKLKEIVKSKVLKVTEMLKKIEEKLQADGKYNQLVECGNGGKRMRQDDEQALGKHATFKKLERLFKSPNLKDPSARSCPYYGFNYYDVTAEEEKIMDETMDKDIVDWFLQQRQSCYVAFKYTEPSARRINFEPFLFFLVNSARKVNPAFQDLMASLYGDWLHRCDVVKKVQRCQDKVALDYMLDTEFKDDKPPIGALLGDVVRCMVVCPTPEDVVEAMSKLKGCKKLTVLRIKNGFAAKNPAFGYRQILVNVLFEANGVSMVCEVQVNLADYVFIKEKIHTYYSISRVGKNFASSPEMYGLVWKPSMIL